MPQLSSDVIRRAATVMKILRLLHQPGMDMVCLKLNMEPTYEELKTAKAWAEAFRLCEESPERRVLEIAGDMEAGRG